MHWLVPREVLPLGSVAHDVFDASICDVHGINAGEYVHLFLRSGGDGRDIGCGERLDGVDGRRRRVGKRDAPLLGGRRGVRAIRDGNGGGWELVEVELDTLQLASAMLPLLEDGLLGCHEKRRRQGAGWRR